MVMNLRQWRESKGYLQREVAEMVGRKSSATIHYWEKHGIKRNLKQLELKRLSKGEITDFTGIDAPYESPREPELVLETHKLSPGETGI